MIKLTTENTAKAVKRCRELKPKVQFIADRTFSVKSANNSNSYIVRLKFKMVKSSVNANVKQAKEVWFAIT